MNILYEDNALVVLDKPAGLSSEEGMTAALRQHWDTPDAFVGVVHRLDTGVSGLMVFARTPAAAGVRAKTIRPDTPVSSRCTTPTKASGVSQCCRRAAVIPSSLDSPAGLSSTTRALSSYRMFTACPRSAGLSVSGCRQWSCRP